jgi:ubiquinone/menaquinone biosynthesis C-methylase UbiE
VLDALGEFRFDSILDLGSGTGAMLEQVVSRPPDVSAKGLDLSPRMAAVASARLGVKAEISVGDADGLPYEDATFDAITCVDSFHHYRRPQTALLEIRRVLRPFGHLVLADFWLPAPAQQAFNVALRLTPYGDVRVYSRAELVIMAARAGLRELSWSRAGRRGQLLVCRSEGIGVGL